MVSSVAGAPAPASGCPPDASPPASAGPAQSPCSASAARRLVVDADADSPGECDMGDPAVVLPVASVIASSLAGAPAFASGRLPDATPTFPAEPASPPCLASALCRPVDDNGAVTPGECGERGPAAALPVGWVLSVTPTEPDPSSPVLHRSPIVGGGHASLPASTGTPQTTAEPLSAQDSSACPLPSTHNTHHCHNHNTSRVRTRVASRSRV
eukprot:scaffold4240_cov120-Isochrysis_galbana.AAC.10